MTTLRCILACLIASALAACSAPPRNAAPAQRPADALDRLAWLAGSWTWSTAGSGSISEEHWTAPAGGSMIGMNRTVNAGKTTFFEYLRIEARDNDVYYFASPKGRQPPTSFKLIESSHARAVFENAEHDFPQRIVYERRGDELTAAIEGTQNGKPRREEWTWRQTGGTGVSPVP